ncbi:MAG TPA: carbohydrate binding domain-containing protein [Pedobacter sp.]|nr:carbohydrate binding domain-containing protein [Pedobacter sp.]
MRFIKSFCLLLLAPLLSCTSKTQIKNPGFDDPQVDTISYWKALPKEGYTASLDASEKYSGSSAMKLTSKASNPGTFMSFSQPVPIELKGLKKVAVTAYIKAADVSDEATLWCRVLDEKGKMIGFENLITMGIKVSGSLDWKKFTLLVTLNEKAKNLVLGGYLGGTGTAWFDDFEIEQLDPLKTPATAPVQAYIRQFIDIVKQNSVFTDSLNWPLIEKNVATLSAGVNTTAAARPVINHVMDYLRAAGDHHSFVQEKVTAERYTKENSNPARPEARLISGNIGYVSVPGFSSTNKEVWLNLRQPFKT